MTHTPFSSVNFQFISFVHSLVWWFVLLISKNSTYILGIDSCPTYMLQISSPDFCSSFNFVYGIVVHLEFGFLCDVAQIILLIFNTKGQLSQHQLLTYPSVFLENCNSTSAVINSWHDLAPACLSSMNPSNCPGLLSCRHIDFLSLQHAQLLLSSHFVCCSCCHSFSHGWALSEMIWDDLICWFACLLSVSFRIYVNPMSRRINSLLHLCISHFKDGAWNIVCPP